MSDKTKKIIKIIVFWAIFIGLFNLCIWSPNIYWQHTVGNKDGFQALCRELQSDSTPVDATVADIILDEKDRQLISTSGRIIYNASQDIFFLQDGIFKLPLDLSGCQNLDDFKNNELLVAVKGANLQDDKGQSLLFVSGLRSTVPEWFQVLYASGVFGSMAFGIFMIVGIAKGIAWLLAKIGIGSRNKQAISPEARKNSQAGYLLLIGLTAPLFWLLNPYFGAVINLLALIFWTRTGWQSQKRTVALVGICLCSLGFIVMTIISLINFSFTKPSSANFFASSLWGSYSANGPKSGILALDPYVNNNEHFTIHPPGNWVKDESGKDNMVVKFETPAQLGTAEGQPIYGKIGVIVITMPAGVTVTDFISQLKKEGFKDKDSKLLSDTTHLLAGGRLEAYYLEITEETKGIPTHILAVIIQKGNKIYFLGAQTPAKDWDTYEFMIRDSLRTFEVL